MGVEICLSNGKPFDFTAGTMDNVTPEVIAHSLGRQCRFAGHTPLHYSVAEHSVWAVAICDSNPFGALMHDAHEAVFQDIIRPLKTDDIRAAEEEIAALFMAKFEYEICDEVRRVDDIMLATECLAFFGEDVLARWGLGVAPVAAISALLSVPWAPEDAARWWLASFRAARP